MTATTMDAPGAPRPAPRDRALLQPVAVAWPTLALALGALAAYAGLAGAALTGALAWWIAVPLLGVAAFAAFTPMHDASHRSIARAAWANEVVGRLSGLLLLAPFPAFRFIHLEHHKNTNDPVRDPDMWSGGARGLLLPVRWATQDLHYYAWYARRARGRPRAEAAETLATLALLYGGAAALVFGGYAAEVFWLALVPARIGVALLAFAFDYLPHRPHRVLASEDPYAATTILEHRALTPLLLGQNYHLIHHLYPGAPFYRYGAAWWALRDGLLERGAVVRKLWGARPPARRRRAPARKPADALHELIVAEVIQETADAKSFVLEVPREAREAFRARAGQFLAFEIPFEGMRIRRCYSLSSAPEVGEPLRVTVKRVPGGRASNWLHENVEPGAKLRATAPAGRFTLREDAAGRPLLLYAAGSGITPVLSLAKAALATTERRVRLLYANRDDASVIFGAELAALAAAHPDRLEVAHHLDAERGLLTPEAAAAFARGFEDADAYACGPAPFMDLVEGALDGAGVPGERRFFERFLSPTDPDRARVQDAASPAEAPERFALTLDGRMTVVPYAPGETLLAAARRAGLSPPSSCEEGYCGACAARLRSGKVRMAAREALTDAEIAEGRILPCQARACSREPLALAYDPER